MNTHTFGFSPFTLDGGHGVAAAGLSPAPPAHVAAPPTSEGIVSVVGPLVAGLQSQAIVVWNDVGALCVNVSGPSSWVLVKGANVDPVLQFGGARQVVVANIQEAKVLVMAGIGGDRANIVAASAQCSPEAAVQALAADKSVLAAAAFGV